VGILKQEETGGKATELDQEHRVSEARLGERVRRDGSWRSATAEKSGRQTAG